MFQKRRVPRFKMGSTNLESITLSIRPRRFLAQVEGYSCYTCIMYEWIPITDLKCLNSWNVTVPHSTVKKPFHGRGCHLVISEWAVLECLIWILQERPWSVTCYVRAATILDHCSTIWYSVCLGNEFSAEGHISWISHLAPTGSSLLRSKRQMLSFRHCFQLVLVYVIADLHCGVIHDPTFGIKMELVACDWQTYG
jgi:hypothetical protein